jgi:hypothetical protein
MHQIQSLKFCAKIIFACLFLIFLAACSSNPGNQEVEKLFREAMQSENFSIEKYEKLNGYSGDGGTYIAEVRYDIIYKKSLEELALIAKASTNGSFIEVASVDLAMRQLQSQFGDFKAGFRATRTEKLAFIKTENGWRIKGG